MIHAQRIKRYNATLQFYRFKPTHFLRFTSLNHLGGVGKYDTFRHSGLDPESSQNKYESLHGMGITLPLSLTPPGSEAPNVFTDGSQNMGFFFAEL
jgi:hypothetical protein